MGWLRLVGSLKSYVSFVKETYERDDIVQKRPIILRSLLIVATPYPANTQYTHAKKVRLHLAAYCNTLQHAAAHCNTLRRTATRRNPDPPLGDVPLDSRNAAHCNTLQHPAAHCSTLKHTETHCSTLKHTAANCNSLQRTAVSATQCSTL